MALETIVVGLIVLLAAAYVVRGLLRTIRGKTACQQDLCAGCASREGCRYERQDSEEPPA